MARPKKRIKTKVMAKKDLKKYKELLLKERESIGGEISHIAKEALKQSQREASGDLSGYTYHMADMASDNYERDFSLGRATEEQKLLYAIDEAMKRIEDGTYGNCLQCGKSISKKRLIAVPHTELCIDCQKSDEKDHAGPS
ncbi:MAG: TraR/DksA C4-type zinc finger protein [Candidatus Omnitrophica bacterium]|nr:TraR/DksA C4-type zinc finger protein [Candidatus Omnitrophota bacterium]